MDSVKNPLGLLGNDPSKLVRVETVSSGLGCNCYCAGCGARFVAVHPTNPRHKSFFRHHNPDADCGSSFETAVHLLAKQVLLKTKRLMLPYLKVRPTREVWRVGTQITHEEEVTPRKLVHFNRVEDEVSMDERRPDIVMWKGDHRLLVEIVVTNDVCNEKLQWIRERNHATVRVNLSWLGYDVDSHILTRCLDSGRAVNVTPQFNIVRWVHHPRAAEAQRKVNQAYLDSIQQDADCRRPPSNRSEPKMSQKELF